MTPIAPTDPPRHRAVLPDDRAWTKAGAAIIVGGWFLPSGVDDMGISIVGRAGSARASISALPAVLAIALGTLLCLAPAARADDAFNARFAQKLGSARPGLLLLRGARCA